MTDPSENTVVGSGESVGDARLEAVARRLGVACGEGRLTLEELSARVREAYVAQTAASLLRALERIPGASLVTQERTGRPVTIVDPG